ncbi:MAG: thiosulfate sulfurtransferase GlpE [Candidatus Marinimicrobia bacterium]|jgi:thiosulfate sulfurtransferase|nr:thiosulfate sulfurtransferase GlpE [Candidatus Neomarinimicrobiota bacterium]MBT5955932.1 thiosulfate sulfurtransferase GlpE [Candidatus Neomarinimicrobiota bacterium]MBT6871217.1 thiosulfate sulfurtransferase GlpE [Candidatus Neomarinimicrobiota bacterium]MBT7378187.1 thiosulfate sulfurtransferase GlpE [Candidatus Neomarinimicrobiota bacterium]
MENKAVKRVNVVEATSLLNTDAVTIVDIRDRQSFEVDHMQNAHHVTGNNAKDFIDKTDKDQPLLVYCYHGNSSQVAAEYFSENGFNKVYTLDGGFDIWRTKNS